MVMANNLISGNMQQAIEMSGLAANGYNADYNLIQGNLIGTDPTGTVAFFNGGGVEIGIGTGNQIGGTTPEARNVISGCTSDAIVLFAGGISTTIQGNYLGTDIEAGTKLGNQGNGMDQSLGGSDGTLIGGDIQGRAM